MDAEGRWPQAKGFAVRLHNSSLLCRSLPGSQKTSTKYSGPDFVGQFVNFNGDSWKFEVPENEN